MWKGDNPPVLTGVIQNLKLQNWTKINTWLFPIRREKNSKSQINSFKISLLWQVRYSHIKRCGTHSSKCIRCYCVAFLHFYDLLGLNCQNISFGINSVGDKTILILSIFFKKDVFPWQCQLTLTWEIQTNELLHYILWEETKHTVEN